MVKIEKRTQIFEGNQFEFRRFREKTPILENQINIIENYTNDNKQIYRVVNYELVEKSIES